MTDEVKTPPSLLAWGCFLFSSQFLAVLDAQLVGTFRAFQRRVGFFPESFRVEQYTQFPDDPDYQRQSQQGEGVKSLHKKHGREHHHVIPVEDAAGGTAFVFHDQPERTPHQHADQITHIEQDTYQEQMGIGQDTPPISEVPDRRSALPREASPYRQILWWSQCALSALPC